MLLSLYIIYVTSAFRVKHGKNKSIGVSLLNLSIGYVTVQNIDLLIRLYRFNSDLTLIPCCYFSISVIRLNKVTFGNERCPSNLFSQYSPQRFSHGLTALLKTKLKGVLKETYYFTRCECD